VAATRRGNCAEGRPRISAQHGGGPVWQLAQGHGVVGVDGRMLWPSPSEVVHGLLLVRTSVGRPDPVRCAANGRLGCPHTAAPNNHQLAVGPLDRDLQLEAACVAPAVCHYTAAGDAPFTPSCRPKKAQPHQGHRHTDTALAFPSRRRRCMGPSP
jgi:hypothetical protein